jgi:hypothetical protein
MQQIMKRLLLPVIIPEGCSGYVREEFAGNGGSG